MAGLPDWKQRQLEELGPEPEAPVLSRGNQSFLARRLSEVKASSGPVPSDLLDSWTDDNDSISAAFLLHPAAREGGSEHDVRHVLAKKQLDLTASLSSKDFTKLAARIQKRGSTLDVGEKTEEQSGNKRSPEEQQAVDALTKLTAEPKWRAEDATPDTFSSWLLCGSAEHASDLGALRKAGVTAVLNCASSACDDPVESYDEYGIKYMELDGEDFEGFPLLELHLEKATKFVDENSAGGIVLVHCFAGVNRSATLAIAMLMLRERRPLLEVTKQCFAARPFILSNESFRLQLVQLAATNGLLGGRDGYTANYPDVS